MKTIETERCILRAFLKEDAEALFAMDADPEVHKYLGNQPVKEIAEVIDDIKSVQNQYQHNGIGRWIILEKSSGNFIGWGGLKYETGLRDNFSYYDLGYRLDRNYWGKGFATETAKASLEYGFTQLGLKDIYAAAHSENKGSINVLKKSGLKFVESFPYDNFIAHWFHISSEEWEKAS